MLACQRYIELNPVRAGMVEHPGEYHWSSYRANGQGEDNALIRSHALYEALGLDAASRQAAYRELFRYELEPGMVDKIRRATNASPPKFPQHLEGGRHRDSRGDCARWKRRSRGSCSESDADKNRGHRFSGLRNPMNWLL
ncbi:MAG: hypothetical protein M0Q22_00450 [Sulfuritalea sp.]|nr:hypothetical protein [Sulfuritalea sp.]